MEKQQKALLLASHVINESGKDSELVEMVAHLLLTLVGKSETPSPPKILKVEKAKVSKETKEAEASASKPKQPKSPRGRGKSPSKEPPKGGSAQVQKDESGISRSTWSTRLKDSRQRAEGALLACKEKKDIDPVLLADYFNKRLTLDEQWKRFLKIFGQGNKKDPVEHLPNCPLSLDDFLSLGFKTHSDTSHLILQDKMGQSLKMVSQELAKKVGEAMRLWVIVDPQDEDQI